MNSKDGSWRTRAPKDADPTTEARTRRQPWLSGCEPEQPAPFHRSKEHASNRITLTRSEVRTLQAGFDSGSNVAFANRLALVGV